MGFFSGGFSGHTNGMGARRSDEFGQTWALSVVEYLGCSPGSFCAGRRFFGVIAVGFFSGGFSGQTNGMGARRSDEFGQTWALSVAEFLGYSRGRFSPVRDPLRRNVVAGKLGIQQGQPRLLTGRRNERD
ncbi:hypothetical protein Adt_13521 [Abeliophyllum distichum]|uniref:Uncharacterized protein n=1 Tax=Abeliophyllum distichum TaxID=126358 RepID=A0ABD1TX15_9LAMI